MVVRRKNVWEEDSEFLSEPQTESILAASRVEIISETATHFLCLCVFHGNDNTPAMAVSKTGAVFTCFNPACAAAGGIRRIIQHQHPQWNPFQVERLVLNSKKSDVPVLDRLKKAMEKPVEYPAFSQDILDRMKADFKGSVAEDYMHSRGFEDDTLDYFDVGFSAKQNMVIVPMHSPDGKPIGLIGRTPSHEDKRFKNSTELPKSKTAWNFHRAKRAGDTVIVTEASYDAMRVHQAGFPCVIALLGGSLSPWHIEQINRTFSGIIIMTDFDKRQPAKPNCSLCKHLPPDEYGIRCTGHRPGRELGYAISNALPNKRISWAAYDNSCVYPHGAKDSSDMTDPEIYQCVTGAVSNIEYRQWNIDNQDLVTLS